MDLPTVLEHEIGHVLGYEHSQTGVMKDTLTAGRRRTPTGEASEAHRSALDWLAAETVLESQWIPQEG
jgi:hypothetical protein